MFLILLLFWLLLMGSVTIETVIIGAVISAALYLLMNRLFGITPKKELHYFPLIWYVPAFMCLMIWEVLKANLTVARLTISRKRKPSPAIIRITLPLKTEFARSVLANSITLTPGTISVDITGDTFTVHVLDSSSPAGLEDWVVLKFLRRAERRLCHDTGKA